MSEVFDNEFILQDRIQKIQQIVGKYGEENFRVSFSGGKDSTVLSALVDMALPDNKIPRVFADTGIELKMIRDFVLKKAKEDERVVIIKPRKNIIKMLQEDGYPFKSKSHSKWVYLYQKNGRTQSIENYTNSEIRDKELYRPCPKKLRYQFTREGKLKISDKCCDRLKKEPLEDFAKKEGRHIAIVGVMHAGGGGAELAPNALRFWGMS